MSNSFAEYFRPKSPNQLIGSKQKELANSLIKRVEEKNIIQKLLLCGPSGSGKTTIARMYIQALLPGFKIDEYIWQHNCSSDTGIDGIRAILESMKRGNLFCPFNIFFLDEIHGLTKAAQNALLADLEGLPSHIIFIACTTEPGKIIDTLASRFSRHDLTYPVRNDFLFLARAIEHALIRDNKISEPFDKAKIEEIVSLSQGNIRTFDTYLEQLADGSYRGYKEPEEDTTSLAYLMFNKTPTIADLFKVANNIQDSYVASSIGICNYAIKILSNNGTGTTGKKAKEALLIFGEGYPNEKIHFYRKLVEWNEAISK